MIAVIFKNLDKSELAREAATERMASVIEKFPDLKASRIRVTLEMENSPIHAGPDLFNVKVHVASGRYRDVRLEKSAPNLYVALADVVEHMLEKLNRFGDRTRVKERAKARKGWAALGGDYHNEDSSQDSFFRE
jgi:ribosome-associated translation inhibitor RaiA